MKRFCLMVVCATVWLSAGRAQTPEEKKATVAYLRGLQTSSGGFLPAAPEVGTEKRQGQPSLRATTAALRALRYSGGKPGNAQACTRFVKECFDKNRGGFADQPRGQADVFSTAVGLMALVELKMPLDAYSGPAAKYLDEHARTFEEIRMAAAGLEAIGKRSAHADGWVKYIAKMGHKDGSFGEGDSAARDTGGAVVAILRLGAELEHKDQVIKTLVAGQGQDGGFGKAGQKASDLESTYRVMRALKMLHVASYKAQRLRRFVARCRNADAGYGLGPGQPSTATATYFAAAILRWLDES